MSEFHAENVCRKEPCKERIEVNSLLKEIETMVSFWQWQVLGMTTEFENEETRKLKKELSIFAEMVKDLRTKIY